ncbi:MAG: hypothetical protein R3321_00035 [Nitrososphaeraceae archaeon]|nr:hypothetical protein [Nitrososphaeraceae archaeon]
MKYRIEPMWELPDWVYTLLAFIIWMLIKITAFWWLWNHFIVAMVVSTSIITWWLAALVFTCYSIITMKMSGD